MSTPLMPSPRPLAPSSTGSALGSASLLANKAPQPPVTIDVTAFQQLQQQFQAQQQQQRIGPPAMPLSAANSASASVTLSQPLAAWPGKAADSQQASNIQTLVHSFNRHASQAPPSFVQPVSFSSSSPPPHLHTLLSQSNSHSLASSPNADRPPSELSYSAVYYPQSPPASALHSLTSGYHQPASPLMSSATYWYDPGSLQPPHQPQQQYVLKMNNGNLVIPAPIAVAAHQSAHLIKHESASMLDQQLQQHQQQHQTIVTPGKHSACAVCHGAKTSCNGQRPCDRCIRLDRQSLCVDRPRKTPVRSDKKKPGKEDAEQGPEADKAKKAFKREHDNGTDEAGVKRVKAEGSVEEETGVARKEPASHAPPTAAPAITAAAAATLDSLSPVRRASSHSSHSSSDSASSATPPSPAGATDELVDVATSSLASEPERRLSVTYLRMHQIYPTRAAIADAIRNGAVTPLQVHFLLSYLKAVLHTDDFTQLLQPLQPTPASTASTLISPIRHLSSLPSDLVNDRGMYTPRFQFNFGCSPLEPVDDNVVGLIDFATLQVIRVDPAEVNSTMDGTVNMNTSSFGLPDSNGPLKAASPSPPVVAFATSSTSAFTAVSSANSTFASTPAPSPDPSSLSSSSSSAIASSPAASLSSPPPPSPSVNTTSTAAENTAQHQDPTSSSTTSPASSTSQPFPSPTPSTASHSPSTASSSSSPVAPSSSSSSDASTSLVPLSTSANPASSSSLGSTVFLTIRVNREFERLFGYSQPYMRDLFRSEGGKSVYRLLSAPDLPLLSKWQTEALIGERTEFKAVVSIINRYKGTTECLVNCRWTLDSGGLFRSVAYCFSPLPEKATSGGGRRMKGDV